MDSSESEVRDILNELRIMAEKWRQRARRKFYDASAYLDPNDFQRRFIEHGAICYLNAAEELEALIDQARGVSLYKRRSLDGLFGDP